MKQAEEEGTTSSHNSDDEAYKGALKVYEREALQGDAHAQYSLGIMYGAGRGVPQSDEKAAEWYEKAAKQGIPEAQNNLAFMYKEGRGVPQSYEKAFKWYQKAAEQKIAKAQYHLGSMYKEGLGVEQSDTEAANWFKRAADQAHVNAKHDLEIMCKKWFKQAAAAYNAAEQAKHPEEKEQFYKQATQLCQKAAEQGFAQAQYALGNMYREGQGISQSDEEAVKWLQKAAEQGHAEAQIDLGLMYHKGQGISQSHENAAERYQMAANHGAVEAQNNPGGSCGKRLGITQVDKDTFELLQQSFGAESVQLLQASARRGSKEAQFGLGLMYVQGYGVPQSYKIAAEWYQKAAEQGFAEAQFSLGEMYMSGRGVPQSDEKAMEWWEKAAAQGFAEAQANLGVMYQKGSRSPQSYENAFFWTKKAAEQGDAVAQYHLGNMYKQGHGVPQSDEKAIEWWEKAATQGEAHAQHNLGVMYQKGSKVPQSDERAAEWYQKAAAQGFADAQYHLGNMYYQGKDIVQSDERAAEWLEKAANQGNAYAQVNFGTMYRKGRGVAQSDEKAVEWYQKAAAQGDASAQNNLGTMYDKGRGVAQSYEKAFEWWQKAATQGFAGAQYNLGTMYSKGRGVTQSDGKAAEWYQKAAEQGYAEAQYTLGFKYKVGQGVAQCDEKAIEWFRKAAAQGLADAQTNLGLMYDEGRGGSQSAEEAIEWYRKAAGQGDAWAKTNLGIMYDEGRGVAQSSEKALEWYQNAAAQGDIGAVRLPLSISYFMGHGTLKNEEKALSYLNKASQKFDISEKLSTYFSTLSLENICSGINLIAKSKRFIYFKDGRTSRHFLLAFPYLEKIRDKNLGRRPLDVAETYQEFAEIGDDQAQLDLGILYHFGVGIRQDLARAFEWYEEAFRRGNEEARNLLGRLHGVFLPKIVKKFFPIVPLNTYRGLTDQDVFDKFKVTAGEGDEKALHQLGWKYLYGWGTEKDQDKAVTCFKKAIEKERYPLALKALADVYQLNDKIYPLEVIRLYRQAAKQKDTGATAAIRKMADEYVTEAIYALAKAYEEGWGIAKDEEEALELYRRAAFEGEYPKAQYAFAIKAPNDSDALDLLSRAAGAEEWKVYLKAIGKKYNPKDLEELEQKGLGYYKAQQALADFYLTGRIIPLKTFDNVLKAYENALRLQEKAFASQGTHLHIESIIQTKSKYDQLKKSQEEGRFSFQEEMINILKNFPSLYEKKEEYDPDFLYQVTYLSQKSFGQETADEVHKMLQLLSSVSEKRKQTKVSKGLMEKLIKTVESERSDEINRLSPLFDLALSKKSWSLIPSPAECSQPLKLSAKALKDPQIEIFNSCIQTPDQSVGLVYFTRSVEKILGMFKNLEEKGLITNEGLFDTEDGKTGTYETLKNFLTHNKSDQRFAYRIVRLSDMLDLKIKQDPEHVAVQLMSWAMAGHFCRERSESETYQYYLAQITDPNQDLNELGRDYWSLELRIALSLAKLRDKCVDELVSQDDPERVHQVAHLKKKARQELSLIGDAEYSQDTLEGISVKPEYRKLSSDKIKEEVLKKYTPDSIISHIAEELKSSSIPYEKLFRRLRFQFLREEFSEASKQALHNLDQSLFKDEDFILSDACDQQYIDKQLTLMKRLSPDLEIIFIDWQALKGRSYEVARQRVSQEFYEDEMMKFSSKGAKAILKGMRYLEEEL